MELKMIKIKDAQTDDERVVIKALSKCNINSYILFDTTYNEKGIVSNKFRHIFIFPDLVVEKGILFGFILSQVCMELILIPVAPQLISYIGVFYLIYGIMMVIRLI